MEWSGCLNEYEKLVIRMNTPRVEIDNAVCASSTLVKIDSAQKDGILLEAVQILTDLNLSIKKAYISSDGRWFMDVFHVTDQNGNKLTDESVISYLEQSFNTSNNTVKPNELNGLTVLELTGTDRLGLLSEVFAVLSDLQCNVVESKVWTHNGRIASLIYVKDVDSGCPIEDSLKIKAERQRVIQCLVASIERRASEGVRLELCTADRQGLLSDVTRTFRENGLNVARAEISTKDDMAHNIFYVTDTAGYQVSSKTIEEVRERIGLDDLIVKDPPCSIPKVSWDDSPAGGVGGAVLVSLGSLVRRHLYSLSSIIHRA
ncbi:hypothetical protein MKW92_039500 [Papaver armeniacum]|nr:hypothetical protein MKW92_039500 [Papaver armeniacum]